MTVELINTGDELLLGRVLNTHAQWLGRRLADAGLPLTRQVSVPDRADAIADAVRLALGRADLVITTGGLGPTCDDLTRERIAELLGLPLEFRPEAWAQVENFFARLGRRAPERTRVEAMAPAGSRVLPNAHGTAPGLLIRVEPNPFRAAGGTSWVALLPGPPRELRPMYDTVLAPWIADEFGARAPFSAATLKTAGVGESILEERLTDPLRDHRANGVELAFCARPGDVEVRLSASGEDAADRVQAAVTAARGALGDSIYGAGDDTLESVVIGRLAALRSTVAVAESCTGGLLAHRLTNVPGASAVFLGGVAAYANAVKTALLGVPAGSIEREGAVSETVASSMASGVRKVVGADYALATTGIAGPGGGTPEKPVGTVWLALAGPRGVRAWRERNPYDRETFKHVSTQQALLALWRALGSADAGSS